MNNAINLLVKYIDLYASTLITEVTNFLITNARLSKSLEKKNFGLFPCLFHRT